MYALAKNCERSELATYQVTVMQKSQIEDDLPIYGRRSTRCRRKIFDASETPAGIRLFQGLLKSPAKPEILIFPYLYSADYLIEYFSKRRRQNKKSSFIRTYKEWPIFLNAKMLATLPGVLLSSSYELIHQQNFPAIKNLKVYCSKLAERNTGGDDS